MYASTNDYWLVLLATPKTKGP